MKIESILLWLSLQSHCPLALNENEILEVVHSCSLNIIRPNTVRIREKIGIISHGRHWRLLAFDVIKPMILENILLIGFALQMCRLYFCVTPKPLGATSRR